FPVVGARDTGPTPCVPSAYTFSCGNRVGCDAPVLYREIPTCPAATRHDFVDDKQNIVSVADLADDSEILRRRDNSARRRSDGRLGNKCADILGTDSADSLLQVSGTIDIAAAVTTAEGTAVAEAGLNMDAVDQHRAEGAASRNSTR